MTQLLEQLGIQDYHAIAASLSQELAATAVERDRLAGLPEHEVQRLRESGLLALTVPRQFGGAGASWIDAMHIIQTLAKADGSTGQLYANHVILCAVPHAIGTPAQTEYYDRLTAKHQRFWANAINTRDTRLRIEPVGDHFRVNGVKSFGTGVAIADLRVFSAIQEGSPLPVFFVIPQERGGVTYNNDWDNMGQRRTASGSYTFNNVLVTSDEVLGPPTNPEGAFPGLLNAIVQLTKTYVYLGIAMGAFETAVNYTSTKARPWLTAGVESATQDPYILHHYGELWTDLQAALSLADKAAQQAQWCWHQQHQLTHAERGEVAIAIATAKTLTTRVGLRVTNQIFELMGARATASQHGFDRYWRDLRTFTLHDPVDYKLREIGNWVLNREFPIVTQYS